jgi:hypothetical protein
MKSILATGLLLFCFAILPLHAAGQDRSREQKATQQGADKGVVSSTNDQIEVKTDRFSNVTTVTLKPQVIFEKPDHFITIEINTKIGEKKSYNFEKEMVQAYVTFESQSKGLVDFGDEELHFIINGRPLNLGKSEFSTIPYGSRTGKLKPDFRLLKFSVKILDRPNLEQFSKANRIEMRLGSIETTLSDQLVATLREYATQALAQHKIANGRQQ